MLIASITIWLLWAIIPKYRLIAWIGGIAFTQILRLMNYSAINNKPNMLSTKHWRTVLRVNSLITGLAWAMLPIFLFPESLKQQVFLPYVIAGITSGALLQLASDRVSVWLFTGSTILSLIIRFILINSEISIAMSIIGFLYLFFIILAAQRNENNLHNMLSLQDEIDQQNIVLSEAQRIAKIGYWSLNTRNWKLNWSPLIFEIFGRDPEFFTPDLHEYFYRLVHPEDVRMVFKQIKEFLRNQEKTISSIDHRILMPDGSTRWINIEVVLAEYSEMMSIYIKGTVHDITDRKISEMRIVKNEQQLQQAQELTQLGSFDWDLVTDELKWSDEHFRLWGITPRSIIPGKELFERYIHPEDLKQWRDTFTQVIQEGGQYKFIHRLIWPDGSEHFIRSQGEAYIDSSGQVIQIIGTAQNITKLQNIERSLLSQSKLQEMNASIAKLFITVNKSNIKAKISSTMEQTGKFYNIDITVINIFSPDFSTMTTEYGWSKKNEEWKRTTLDDFPIDGIPWFLNQIIIDKSIVYIPDIFALPEEAYRVKSLLQELRIKSSLSIPIYTDQKVYGFLSLNMTNDYISWSNNQINGLTVVSQILASAFATIENEQKLLALQKNALSARDIAEKSSQAKSDFLASMSHELRTPLNAILGFGQVLEMDRTLDSLQLDYIHEIIEAGNHLLSLINEVLDLAKIESGKMDFTIEPINCIDIIDESIGLIQSFAEEKNILIDFDSSKPMIILADRTRLKQILINLLTNAIKYNTPQGKVHISTALHNSLVRITVSDTGDGIPPEKIKYLFTPFNRLGRESGDIEGTGIGLAFAKQLAEIMGGTVDYIEDTSEGSSFFIDLPIAKDESFQIPMKNNTIMPVLPLSTKQSCILYIEDNKSNLKLVEHILSKRDNLVLITAVSGNQGLVLAESYKPKLILLDLNLPDMKGSEVLIKIRESDWGNGIPVVAVTASAMTDNDNKTKFNEYITKPINIPNFLEVIDLFICDDNL